MSLTQMQAKAAMLTKAQGSGLKALVVAKLRFEAHSADTLRKAVNHLPQYRAAFAIPYFDLTGKPTKFFRVRYVEDEKGFGALTTKRPMRYAQPAGTLNEIYLPPFVDWRKIATDVDTSIIVTEGELKAACATKMGLPAIGLGGVTMFGNKKNGEFLLPMLQQFEWKDRRVYVVFDSDAATNPQVLRAESMLCRELTQMGAVCFIVRLPKLDDGKTGLDDFMTKHTLEEFVELTADSHEYEMSAELHRLNEEVIYVNAPDLIFKPSEDLRMRTDKFATSHYANRRFIDRTGKTPVEKSTAAEWLKWEQRAEVKNFTYQPGDEAITESGCLNLWQPWPHTPRPGDVSMWHRVMEHIFTNTEPEARRYFEQWVAYPMQHPGAKLNQAVLFWGGQGTGKSFVDETLMRVYGAHNSVKFENKELMSNFNDWAEHKQFGLGEEIVVHAGEKRVISEMLKTLVTSSTIAIHRKYLNTYTLPNCMNIFLSSNHAAALKLEEDDRRFFVHHVKTSKMPVKLYQPFDIWSKSESGLAALFHYFLTLDTADFDPQAAAYHTADRAAMIAGGRSEHGAWVAELKTDPGSVLKLGNARSSYCLYSADDLLAFFKVKHERSQVTATTLANELAMQGFKRAYEHPLRTANGSKRLWVISETAELLKVKPSMRGDFYDAERGGIKRKQSKF